MITRIGGQDIHFPSADLVPPVPKFHGRERELRMCRAAWGIDPEGRQMNGAMHRLYFRLQGPPGVGKNEIVYQLVREIQSKDSSIPFYMIQGHEELTPEDLGLILVPDEQSGEAGRPSLILRGSPLAAAIRLGGIFFFDEINRVPERALAPLAAVLDTRQHFYSAMTGLRIEPRDDDAKARFRFCCALNPLFSESGTGGLPDYIAERTIPCIEVAPQPFEELCDILQESLGLKDKPDFLESFRRKYKEQTSETMSLRRALSLMKFALNLGDPDAAFDQLTDEMDEVDEIAETK